MTSALNTSMHSSQSAVALAPPAPSRPVVHVTTVHPRDDVRIFHKECVSLAQAGYAVVQVVSDGLGDALVQGVHIVDVGARPRSRIKRLATGSARVRQAVQALQPALVHVHDPELLPLAAALAGQGIPAVYDAHEDVPRQMLTKQWIWAAMRPTLAAAFERYENIKVKRLAAVAAATPHIAQRFATVAARSVAVCNYPRPEELGPAHDPGLSQSEVQAGPRERAACYVGGLMRTRGLLNMVRAVALVPDLQFIVCGRFEDAAFEAELRAEPGWQRVQYLGQVGREGVREVLARASVGLVTLLPLPSYVDSLPIKMFEYMSAGLPVVASDFALWRGIVQGDAGAAASGVCVNPDDVQAMAGAIKRIVDEPGLASAMGLAGQRAVRERYHWAAAERALLELYVQLIGPPEPRPRR